MLVNMKEYHRWLDEATDDELSVKKDALLDVLDKLTDENLVSDVRYYIRLIEEEVIARQCLK